MSVVTNSFATINTNDISILKRTDFLVTVFKNKFIPKRTEFIEQGIATCAAAFSRSSIFLIMLINTQYLSADDFGVFSILLLISNIINAIVSCGGDMWLNRFTRSYHAQKKYAPLVSRFYLKISIGLVFLIFSVAFAARFLELFNLQKQELALFYSLVWASSAGLIETILAILRTTGDIKLFFSIRDFCMPLVLILSIIIFKLHSVMDFFQAAAFIWVIVLFILFLYIFKFSKLYLPKSPRLHWKKFRKGLLSYTIKLIFNNFSSRISNSFDSLILAYYLPVDLIGKYRLGVQFSNAFRIIQHFVFLTLPWHMRIVNGSSDQKGAQILKSRNQLLLSMALIALMFLLLFMKPLLNLFDQDYQVIAAAISAFLIIRFSELLWGPQHEILISNNKIFSDTLTNMFGLFAGGLSFFIMIQFYNPITSGVISAGLNSFITQLCKYQVLKVNIEKHNQSSDKYLPWIPLLLTLSGMSYVAVQQ